jgi:hypothetical protein
MMLIASNNTRGKPMLQIIVFKTNPNMRACMLHQWISCCCRPSMCWDCFNYANNACKDTWSWAITGPEWV